jgi:uncharacterized protein (TIGR00730 family)
MINPTGFSILVNSIRTTAERLAGHFFIKSIGSHITVMGSARILEDNPLYQEAKNVGETITKHGFAVLTGGGPGMMEATNQGAYEHNQKSFGVSIKIPREQKSNPYLSRNLLCHSFCSRKYLLLQYCDAIVFLPGGYGTFDELFEALTLIKTLHLASKPLILVNKEFWQPVVDHLKTLATKYQTISENEMDLISIIDIDELDHELATISRK